MRSQVPLMPSWLGCLRNASSVNCRMMGRAGREGRAGRAGIEGKAGIEGRLLCAAFHASVERRLMVPPILSMVVMDGFPGMAVESAYLGELRW